MFTPTASSVLPLVKEHGLWKAEGAGWTLDYSYHGISARALSDLIQNGKEPILKGRTAMLGGQLVNTSEKRRAWHVLLRQFSENGLIKADSEFSEVKQTRERMKEWAEALHSGNWINERGERFTDLIAIGIGGSYLGTKTAYEAMLSEGMSPKIRVHFLVNVDHREVAKLISSLNPTRTLVYISSKSMSTSETIENARCVFEWLKRSVSTDGLSRHVAAATSQAARIESLGVKLHGVLPLWDWVGGRFSVWSAIGFPLVAAFGYASFEAFLKGAEAMDQHFAKAEPSENLPMLLAMISHYYREQMDSSTHALLLYHHGLRFFADYLQQVEMESNGKSVRTDGSPLGAAGSCVIWGNEGTNGQHSFHQLLHQGREVHPTDFITTLSSLDSGESSKRMQRILLSNALAQREVFLSGKSQESIVKELMKGGLSQEEAERLAPHKAMPGGRPSNLLYTRKLTPEALGALMALYEHRTACLGWLWGVNSFDQFGVELGKVAATEIQAYLETGAPLAEAASPSLFDLLKQMK